MSFSVLRVLRNVKTCTCDKTIRPVMLWKIGFRPTNAFLKRKHGKRRTPSACRCSRKWAPDHNTKPHGAHAGHLPTKCMLLSKIGFRPTNAFLKRKHGKRRTFRLPLLSKMGSRPQHQASRRSCWTLAHKMHAALENRFQTNKRFLEAQTW